jgi:hypothetical protein
MFAALLPFNMELTGKRYFHPCYHRSLQKRIHDDFRWGAAFKRRPRLCLKKANPTCGKAWQALGIRETFLAKLADTVINTSMGAYPHMDDKRDISKR